MDIDQVSFNFIPHSRHRRRGHGGFLVSAVGLDLTWEQFRRILRSPGVPLIGLVAQFIILPVPEVNSA